MKYSIIQKNRSFKATSFLILGIMASLTVTQKVWASDLAESTILRGTDDNYVMESQPPRYNNWAGFYIGGQAGYVQSSINFGDTLNNLLTVALESTPYEPILKTHELALATRTSNSAGYGGFTGYNWNFSGTLFGFEIEYSSANLNVKTTNSEIQQNTVIFDQKVNGADGIEFSETYSAVKVKNLASLRLRGGFAIGNFLPYGFLGLSVGQGSTKNVVMANTYKYVVPQETIISSGGVVIVAGQPYSEFNYGPISLVNDQTHSIYWWGYTIGGGTEINFTDHLFARVEYAFTALDSGSKSGQPQINKVMGGLGLRF